MSCSTLQATRQPPRRASRKALAESAHPKRTSTLAGETLAEGRNGARSEQRRRGRGGKKSPCARSVPVAAALPALRAPAPPLAPISLSFLPTFMILLTVEEHTQRHGGEGLQLYEACALFSTTPSNFAWNHFIASSLVTRCCTPTLDSCLRRRATRYPGRSSTT